MEQSQSDLRLKSGAGQRVADDVVLQCSLLLLQLLLLATPSELEQEEDAGVGEEAGAGDVSAS